MNTSQSAAEALESLIEEMRRTGRKNGRIEVLIEDYKPRELRIVKISESVNCKKASYLHLGIAIDCKPLY